LRMKPVERQKTVFPKQPQPLQTETTRLDASYDSTF
jgi:hypothetical protein